MFACVLNRLVSLLFFHVLPNTISTYVSLFQFWFLKFLAKHFWIQINIIVQLENQMWNWILRKCIDGGPCGFHVIYRVPTVFPQETTKHFKMSNWSSDLAWQVSRRNSSFRVVRREAAFTMSKDPMSLTGVFAKRFSGCNDNAVNVVPMVWKTKFYHAQMTSFQNIDRIQCMSTCIRCINKQYFCIKFHVFVWKIEGRRQEGQPACQLEARQEDQGHSAQGRPHFGGWTFFNITI